MDTPRFRPARREAYLARDPLRAFRVEWDAATREDADELEQVLDEACRNPRAAERERALQRYLEAYPHLLAEYARGGHSRWVIPQKSLGGQHIPDFLIGQLSSDGFGWILVELESPTALMFRKDGDPSAALVHALRQITDWRAWLERNRDFATRARTDAGLGLTDISPNSHGLIIIGRERDLNPADQPRRRRLAYDNRIEIRSYDYLLRLVRRQSPSMAEAAEVLDWFKPQG